jgi:formylglycine-generating enzyme required for sulfatase activity
VALGRLGDPRPGVGLKDGLPDIDWCDVEAGPFVMGSDEKHDRMARYDETPQFTCNLINQPYRISRYPVTVAQYGAFVEAGGYRTQRYWTEAGWRWRSQKKIDGPRSLGGVFETPNHPQVGVSWYEAVAFCAWLSEVSGKPARLPTEAEWERAARHVDGRIYPWDEPFDARRCNMRKTGVGASSAVGLFPNGRAECGALDMSGNVWEWCSTKWRGDYEDYDRSVDDSMGGDYPRVLWGGAFGNNHDYVRCAVRLRFNPVLWDDDVGFRLVASPGY